MNSTNVDDVRYGHLGDITYHHGDKSWLPIRTPSKHAPFVFLTHGEECFPPSISPKQTPLKPAERQAAIQDITLSHADLGAATSAIAETLHDADQTLTFSIEDQFLDGDLLAITRIEGVSGSNEVEHSRFLAVFPTGEYGEKLRLTVTCEYDETINQSQESNRNQDVSLIWQGNGKRVHQICFSTSQQGNSKIMAVRYQISIRILKVKMFSTPFDFPRLKITELATFRTQHIDTGSLVDVCFNPWNGSQMAVLDSSGAWVICQIHRRHQNISLKQLHTGIVEPRELYNSETPFDTSWGRITWIKSSDYLLVCTMQRMVLFGIEGDLICTQDLSFGSTPSMTSRILDVRPSPLNDQHVFLVTTDSLIWSSLTDIHGAEQTGHTKQFEFLLESRHYRDSTDTTLRISFREIQNGMLSLILYSRRSPLVTESVVIDPQSSSVETPTLRNTRRLLPLTTGTFPDENPLEIFADILMLKVDSAEVSHLDIMPTPDCSFYTMIGLSLDMALMTRACCDEKYDLLYESHDTSSIGQLIKPFHRLRWLGEGERNVIVNAPEYLGKSSVLGKYPGNAAWMYGEDPWSVSRETIYESIEADEDAQSFPEALDETFTALSDEADNVHLQTLSSLIGRTKTVNFESDAKTLYRLLDHSDDPLPDLTIEISLLATSACLGLDDVLGGVSAASLYRFIADLWGTSDSDVKLISTRRRLIENISINLISSCVGIQKDMSALEFDAKVDAEHGSKMPRSYFAPSSTVETKYTPSSSPLSANSLKDKTLSPPSQNEPIELPVTHSDPVVARLQKFTNIGNSTTSANKLVKSTLLHWIPGASPFEYDYLASCARVSDPDSVADEASASRLQVRQRRQRIVKRENQSGEEIEQFIPGIQSSQGPNVTTSQSSSGFPSQMVASQVEPGRFGGRPGMRVKKARRPGFQ